MLDVYISVLQLNFVALVCTDIFCYISIIVCRVSKGEQKIHELFDRVYAVPECRNGDIDTIYYVCCNYLSVCVFFCTKYFLNQVLTAISVSVIMNISKGDITQDVITP